MKLIRAIAIGVIAILVIIVIAQNSEEMETRLLFVKLSMPRWMLLALNLLIGYILGILSAVYFDSPSRKVARAHRDT